MWHAAGGLEASPNSGYGPKVSNSVGKGNVLAVLYQPGELCFYVRNSTIYIRKD